MPDVVYPRRCRHPGVRHSPKRSRPWATTFLRPRHHLHLSLPTRRISQRHQNLQVLTDRQVREVLLPLPSSSGKMRVAHRRSTGYPRRRGMVLRPTFRGRTLAGMSRRRPTEMLSEACGAGSYQVPRRLAGHHRRLRRNSPRSVRRRRRTAKRARRTEMVETTLVLRPRRPKPLPERKLQLAVQGLRERLLPRRVPMPSLSLLRWT